jgi:CRP-like cAMP-binding protein
MFELFTAHINSKIRLTPAEMELVISFYFPKSIAKNQLLVQPGKICTEISFVNKGCLRSYSMDAQGNKHILQFAVANWIIADMESFVTGIPSKMYIDAIKDADLVCIHRNDYEEMLLAVPKMEKYYRLLGQSHIVASQRRVNAAISYTAEQKYVEFSNNYPDLIQAAPQHMIASYLGMTPETLSRVKKQQFKKK